MTSSSVLFARMYAYRYHMLVGTCSPDFPHALDHMAPSLVPAEHARVYTHLWSAV
jgi:hypothetical protein